MTLYYKMRQIWLQNATSILLQNATEVYYKMRQVFYYKMRQFYHKMWQLLQIDFITKCDVYYKLRQYTYQEKQNIFRDIVKNLIVTLNVGLVILKHKYLSKNSISK